MASNDRYPNFKAGSVLSSALSSSDGEDGNNNPLERKSISLDATRQQVGDQHDREKVSKNETETLPSSNGDSDDEDQKLQAKRAYNRANAARARKRIKDQMADLCEKIENACDRNKKLKEANDELLRGITTLSEENQLLRRMVMDRHQVSTSAASPPPPPPPPPMPPRVDDLGISASRLLTEGSSVGISAPPATSIHGARLSERGAGGLSNIASGILAAPPPDPSLVGNWTFLRPGYPQEFFPTHFRQQGGAWTSTTGSSASASSNILTPAMPSLHLHPYWNGDNIGDSGGGSDNIGGGGGGGGGGGFGRDSGS